MYSGVWVEPIVGKVQINCQPTYTALGCGHPNLVGVERLKLPTSCSKNRQENIIT